MVAPCRICKQQPTQLPPEGYMCGRCGVTCKNLRVWDILNGGVKKKDIHAAIDRLHGPISTLQAVCAITDDAAIRALAAKSLESIAGLQFDDYMANKEAAAEFQKELRALGINYR